MYVCMYTQQHNRQSTAQTCASNMTSSVWVTAVSPGPSTVPKTEGSVSCQRVEKKMRGIMIIFPVL